MLTVGGQTDAVPPPQPPTEETTLPTLESISQSSSSRKPKIAALSPTDSPKPTSPIPPAQHDATAIPQTAASPDLEETEEEAGQQGAFNEETGEINWDCPCLGGMAHGPCGEQFRAAFSCFVFSKEEPKGMDCIEHFKTMQGCFREHPEEYGSELEEDEVDDELDGERVSGVGGEGEGEELGGIGGEGLPAPARVEARSEVGSSPAPAATASGSAYTPSSDPGPVKEQEPSSKGYSTQKPQAAEKQMYNEHGKSGGGESDVLVPKAAFDARGGDDGK